MESQTMFLDCPAHLDEQGLARCGLPAEVMRRFIMRSTGGPLESVMISCPAGHFFNAPIECLSLEKHPGTAPPPSAPSGPPSNAASGDQPHIRQAAGRIGHTERDVGTARSRRRSRERQRSA